MCSVAPLTKVFDSTSGVKSYLPPMTRSFSLGHAEEIELCDALGRRVTQQGQKALSTLIVLPPCTNAALSTPGSQKLIAISRYISIAVDSAVRACSCWPIMACSVPTAAVAVRLEWAHAQLLSQGEGLPVVGFSLRDIGIRDCCGHGPHQAKVQPATASSPRAFCPLPRGQRRRGPTPGLLAVSPLSPRRASLSCST